MKIIFGRFCSFSVAAVALLACTGTALAQTSPPEPNAARRAQAAQPGVELSELAPNAPDTYTVKSGDTLWAISGVFLKKPWRWPDLWQMNRADIRNPHRIYPGQQLRLEKINGRAVLRTGSAGDTGNGASTSTLRLSPKTRSTSLADAAIPTLSAQAIEPFLAEPMIVDEVTLATAPRIVAAQEGRVLLSRGDRAYASGAYADSAGKVLNDQPGEPVNFRVFRNVKPLKDPATQTVLGYEAQYVGQAELVRGETTMEVPDKDGKLHTEKVPATIDIVGSKEEMRVGDRLIAEPPRQLRSYVPRAPSTPTTGQIVSVYGSAVVQASANQIVVINRGSSDGMEPGHVLAILKDGERLQDKTDSARTQLKLPNERNGLLMVFRTFDRLSYALILQVTDGVRVGDHFANPN